MLIAVGVGGDRRVGDAGGSCPAVRFAEIVRLEVNGAAGGCRYWLSDLAPARHETAVGRTRGNAVTANVTLRF